MTRFMRRVPQPVTIVTASNTNVNPEGGPETWRGATISSFNTVTLDPEPIISFNIKKVSSTFDAIEASGRFWVHFLTVNPSAIRLADKFTKGHNQELFKGVRIASQSYAESDHEEDSIKLESHPMIKSLVGSRSRVVGEQVAFILDCVYLKDKTIQIGDHVVVFGTVTTINSNKGLTVKDKIWTNEPCLVYVDRGYHDVKHLEARPEEAIAHKRASYDKRERLSLKSTK